MAIAILAVIGCGKPEKRETKKVIATVNDKKIYLDELQAKLGPANAPEDKEALVLKKEMLGKMIERELILQEAERLGIRVSEEEVNNGVKSLFMDYSPEDLEKALEREEINFEQWKKKAKEDLMVKKLIYQEVNSKISVSDKEIKEYYEQNKKEFYQPPQTRALQIVVETEEEAYRILEELSLGKDFKKLAKEKSISPDAARGGDLGFFGKGEMPEEFDEAVFKLEKNETSDVVRTPYGFHIFKVIDKRKGGIKSLSDVKEKIKAKLLMQKQDEQFIRWIEGLRKKSKITVNEELLS